MTITFGSLLVQKQNLSPAQQRQVSSTVLSIVGCVSTAENKDLYYFHFDPDEKDLEDKTAAALREKGIPSVKTSFQLPMGVSLDMVNPFKA
jgi:hypothetical protein